MIATRTTIPDIAHRMMVVGLAAVFTVPFLWIVLTSFKTEAQIFRLPPEWIPRPVVWINYAKALFELPLLTYARNTFLVVVLSTLGVLISSVPVAYSLSQMHWPDRDLLLYVLVGTLMIPGQAMLIPVFILFRQLGMVNTLYPLIIPSFFGNAFFIFLLRQFFLTLPRELFESARIDGASELRCIWNIVVPLSKPALLTVMIFSAIGAWNDFMGPLIYLSSENMKTLAVGLQSLKTQYNTQWGLLMGAATLMTVPILVLFFFAQRHFIEGIALTGMKN